MPDTPFIGQAFDFEIVDRDSDSVSNADLFRDNEVTMANLRGIRCDDRLAEKEAPDGRHTRLRAKG